MNTIRLASYLLKINTGGQGCRKNLCCIYPSYFKLQARWLRSLTPVTYLCTLLGIPSLAAFLQLELFRV